MQFDMRQHALQIVTKQNQSITIKKLYWINKYIYQKEGAQMGLEIPCKAHLQLNFKHTNEYA